MAIQLGSAYGKVTLDASGVKKGVDSGIHDLQRLALVGEQVGKSLTDLGNKLTIGVTLPILALGGASLKAASDFEETKNKTKVVFGEMADSVVANANRSATALGIGKQKYLDYASSIGAALTAGGMGVKEAAELSENAVKHFSDLVSFHNARVEDVAAAWQSAIRGQYEPIQKFFPFINDQYLKTYGIANGLLDANTKTLTANQRAIILNAIAFNEKLNPALNDFAETSGSLANQVKTAQEQFHDLLIELGTNLLPIALEFVTALNDMLAKFNQMTPVQQKMVIGFLGILAAMGPVLSILGTLITKISTIIAVLPSITAAFSGLSISTTGITASMAGLGAALSPILILLLTIAGVVIWWAALWKLNIFDIQGSWRTMVSVIKSLWAALTAFLRGDTEAAVEYLQEAWTTFTDKIQERWEKWFGWVFNAWTSFVNFLRGLLPKIRDYIVTAFSNTNWSQVGQYILIGLANGMLLGVPNLLKLAADIAKKLLETIKKGLGISSPSLEAMKLGMYTAQGFQMGLQKVSPEDMAQALVRPIASMNNSQQQTIIQNFSSGLTVSQARQMISENNEQLMNTMISALGGA